MSTVSSKAEAPQAALPWSPWLATIFIVAAFFASQIIASLLASLYPVFRHWSAAQADDWLTNGVVGQFVYVLIAEALSVGFVYLFLRRFKSRLSVVGFKRPRWTDPLWGLVAFPAYLLAFIAIVAIVEQFYPGLNVNQAQQIGFNSVYGAGQMILTFISLVILPPLAEEIMVRGLLFTSLRKSLRLRWAILITSVIFAAAHLPEGGSAGPLYIAALDTFTLSVVLCYLREKTGSLWPGITLHALKNTVAFVSLFILSTR